jgi:hypothetical protein
MKPSMRPVAGISAFRTFRVLSLLLAKSGPSSPARSPSRIVS